MVSRRVRNVVAGAGLLASALLAGCGGQAPEPVPPRVEVRVGDFPRMLFLDERVPLEVRVSDRVDGCDVRVNDARVGSLDGFSGVREVEVSGWVYGENTAVVSCVYDGGSVMGDASFRVDEPVLSVDVSSSGLAFSGSVSGPDRDGVLSVSAVYSDGSVSVLEGSFVSPPSSLGVWSGRTPGGVRVSGSVPFGGVVVYRASWSDGKGHSLERDVEVSFFDPTPVRIFYQDGSEVTNGSITVAADGREKRFGVLVSSPDASLGGEYLVDGSWKNGDPLSFYDTLDRTVDGVIGSGTFYLLSSIPDDQFDGTVSFGEESSPFTVNFE